MVKTTGGNEIELFNPYTVGILVVGMVHGDEPQGDYLIRKYYKETPDTKLIMIPCLNPDGMQKNSRTNSFISAKTIIKSYKECIWRNYN